MKSSMKIFFAVLLFGAYVVFTSRVSIQATPKSEKPSVHAKMNHSEVVMK